MPQDPLDDVHALLGGQTPSDDPLADVRALLNPPNLQGQPGDIPSTPTFDPSEWQNATAPEEHGYYKHPPEPLSAPKAFNPNAPKLNLTPDEVRQQRTRMEFPGVSKPLPETPGAYKPSTGFSAIGTDESPPTHPSGPPDVSQQLTEAYRPSLGEYAEPAGGIMAWLTHIYQGMESRNPFATSPERLLAEKAIEAKGIRKPGTLEWDPQAEKTWNDAVDTEMKSPENLQRTLAVKAELDRDSRNNPLMHLATSGGSMGQILLNVAALGKVMPGGPVGRVAQFGTEEAAVPEIKGNAEPGTTPYSRFKEGAKTGALYEITGGLGRKLFGPVGGEIASNAGLGAAMAPKGEKVQGGIEGALLGAAMSGGHEEPKGVPDATDVPRGTEPEENPTSSPTSVPPVRDPSFQAFLDGKRMVYLDPDSSKSPTASELKQRGSEPTPEELAGTGVQSADTDLGKLYYRPETLTKFAEENGITAKDPEGIATEVKAKDLTGKLLDYGAGNEKLNPAGSLVTGRDETGNEIATISATNPETAKQALIEQHGAATVEERPGSQINDVLNERAQAQEQHGFFGRKAKPPITPATPGTPGSEIIERRSLMTKLQEIRDHIASGGKASPIVSGKGSPATGRKLGLFRRKGEDVFVKRAEDVETLVHETTHHVSKYLWKTPRERDAALAPFASELEPMASPGHPLEEGFAEYVRTLIEDPQKAAKDAPSFSQHFPQMLEAKDPVLASHIADLQDSYQAWYKQGEWGRAKSVIVEPEKPSLLRSLREGKNDIITYWDKFLAVVARPRRPVEAVVRRYAEQKGRTVESIPADVNPAMEMKQSMAAGGRGNYFTDEGVLDFNSQKVRPGTEGFKKILADLKPSEKHDFETWWVLKRAQGFLNQRAPADRMEQAQRYAEAAKTLVKEQMRIDPDRLDPMLKDIERAHPDFQGIADRLKVLSDGALDYLVDGGAMGRKDAEYLKTLPYAAWQRLVEDLGPSRKGSGRSVMSGQGAIKKLRGKNERPIVSPLAAMNDSFYRLTQAAENAHIRRDFFKILNEVEGHGVLASKLQTPMRPVTFELTDIKRVLKDEGIDTDQIDLKTMAQVFRPDPTFKADKDKQQVSFINDKGQTETWQIHDKALFESLTGYDREIGNLGFKVLKNTLGLFTTLKRAAVVTAPGFAFGANPIRDLPQRFVNTGKIPLPLKNYFKGLLGVAGLTEDASRLFNEAEWDGALLGTLTTQTMSEAHESVKTAMASTFSPRRVVHTMREVARRYMMLGEAGPRLETYQDRLDKPLPQDVTGRAQKIRAAAEARESTVDFSEVGRWIKPLAPFKAFYSAGIQSAYKLGEAAVKHPYRLGAVGASLVGASITNWLLNNSEDWKSEVWQNLPSFEKAGYWIHIGGDKEGFEAAKAKGKAEEAKYVSDHAWKLPKLWELGFVFGTIPENLMDAWKKKVTLQEARDRIESAGKQALPDLLPVPDALQMFYEQSSGLDTFRDRPIVPKSQETIDPDYQFGPQTSETAKHIAWATNDALRLLSGKDHKDPGYLSPYQLDYFLNVGPMAKSTLDASDDAIRFLEGTEVLPSRPSQGMRDVPFLGDIARRFSVNYPGAASTPVTDFYELKDKLNQTKDTFDSLKKRATYDELKQYVEDHKFEIGMSVAADKVGLALSAVRTKMNADMARRDISPDQKIKLRDESLMNSMEITQKWLLAYKSAEKK